MADTIVDFWEENNGVLDMLGARLLNTTPVSESESGISVSFANTPGSPIDAGGLLAAPDETPPLSEDGWKGLILSAPIAGITFGNPGRNRLGTLPGELCLLFEDDLYNRVHIDPRNFALGNVLADTSVTFEIWNAFFIVRQLDSVSEINTLGLALNQPTPPGDAPSLFPPLSSFVYTIDVESEGLATIAATFTFEFDNGSDLPVVISGQRLTLFPHCPQRGFTEGLMWKTDIMESWDGGEQRVRMRKLPRQDFAMSYRMDNQNERATAQNALFGGPSRTFGVPLFHVARDLGADLSPGATVISVDTTNMDFRSSTTEEDRLVVLWREYNDFEVSVISVGGVTASTITINQGLVGSHPAATTIVMPVQISLLNDSNAWSVSRNAELQDFTCQWLAEEVTDLADLSGLPTHEGTVVFDDPNYIQDVLTETMMAKFRVFDGGVGNFVVAERRLSPEINFAKGFETQNDADSFTLRKRLYGLLGRQKAFYIPTFRKDFVLVNTIGGGDINLDVEPVGYTRFNPNTYAPFGDIMIELNDGTRFFREIVGTVEGVGLPAREELEMKTNLGVPVLVSDVKRISFLYKVRLASDRIEIFHGNRGHYSVRIPLIGIRV